MPRRKRGAADMWVQEQLHATDPARLPLPRVARSVSLITSTAVLAGVAALGFIPVSQVVATAGRVVSKDPTVLVQALETSILRSIRVQPGQRVSAGTVVAELDP